MDRKNEYYLLKQALFELYQNSLHHLKKQGHELELECCDVSYEMLKHFILIQEQKSKS